MTKLKLLLATTLALLLVPFNIAQAQATRYLPDVGDVVATASVESVILNWQAVAGADSYTVYYGADSVATDGGIYENSIAVENTTQYEVAQLVADTTYYFAVAAEDSTGTMLGSPNYSAEVSATPTIETAVGNTTTPIVDPVAPTKEPLLEAAPAEPDLIKSGPESVWLATMLIALAGAYIWRRRVATSQL